MKRDPTSQVRCHGTASVCLALKQASLRASANVRFGVIFLQDQLVRKIDAALDLTWLRRDAYSITSSALASSVGGITMPSALRSSG